MFLAANIELLLIWALFNQSLFCKGRYYKKLDFYWGTANAASYEVEARRRYRGMRLDILVKRRYTAPEAKNPANVFFLSWP